MSEPSETKQTVLAMLSQGQTLSGEELSRRLGVTRAAVWKAVEALRAEGYVIASRTRVGYRLAARPDNLSPEEITRFGGADAFPGAPLYCYACVEGSTNQLAKELALSGAPHGTAVIADTQTGGRGRFGRPFFSPPGRGVYLSLIARPGWPPERYGLLTILTAAAVSDAVEAVCGRRPAVKWVNDLLLDGLKIAGILTELSFEGESGQVDSAVIGIGLNGNGTTFPDELTGIAGSLEMAAGRPVVRAQLAAQLLCRLADMFRLREEDIPARVARYRADCVTLGRTVTVTRGERREQGQALALEDDGALRVRFGDGRVEAVRSGEVTLHIEDGSF
ncbi:MAG: biotin--[acetyl-CoA-carboxylase] ligase [Oscillospiraceae bacterium]|jgi:BirA family biotin operon repressor/biotin-[acetyl-CoA-carboxylase] ligase|nr:biotin--[acetyl-CoA-carboxylase] ligase [Oscillospiraceae bacterium]